MNNELMFSSAYDAWATPQDFFDKLNEKYNFDFDVCAEPETAKCKIFFTKEDDALTIDFHAKGIELFDYHPICFMNPPYGRQIGKFVKMAKEQSINGCVFVCLLPSRTDTKWFHEYIWDSEKGRPRDGVKIDPIKGRLVFGTDEYWAWVWEQEYLPNKTKKNNLYKKYGKRNPAPFPSIVVTFDPEITYQPSTTTNQIIKKENGNKHALHDSIYLYCPKCDFSIYKNMSRI